MSGLTVINRDSWYRQLSPGLKSVLDLSPRPYTEDTIKFQTAPILNATGRLFDAGSASVLKALITTEPTAAAGYAAKMKAINQRRKDLVAQWLAAVEEAAAGQEEAPILFGPMPGNPGRGLWASSPESSARPTNALPSSSPTLPVPLACSGDPAGPMGTLTSPPDPCGHALRGKCRRPRRGGRHHRLRRAVRPHGTSHHPVGPGTTAPQPPMTRCTTIWMSPRLTCPPSFRCSKPTPRTVPAQKSRCCGLRGLRLQTRGGQCYRLMGKGHEHLKLFGQVSDAVGV